MKFQAVKIVLNKPKSASSANEVKVEKERFSIPEYENFQLSSGLASN